MSHFDINQIVGLPAILTALLFWTAVAHPNRITNLSLFRASVATTFLSMIIPPLWSIVFPERRSATEFSLSMLPYLHVARIVSIAVAMLLGLLSVTPRQQE